MRELPVLGARNVLGERGSEDSSVRTTRGHGHQVFRHSGRSCKRFRDALKHSVLQELLAIGRRHELHAVTQHSLDVARLPGLQLDGSHPKRNESRHTDRS